MNIKIDISKRYETPTDFAIYDSASQPHITNYGHLDMKELVQLLDVLITMRREIAEFIPEKYKRLAEYAEERERAENRARKELQKLRGKSKK